MTPSMHIPIVHVALDAIRDNYRLLCSTAVGEGGRLSPSAGGDALPAVMPVIKSDAYGHGQVAVGKELVHAGAKLIATGSVAEGALLRAGLAGTGSPRILSLLGTVCDDDIALAVEYDIIPVVQCFEQIEQFKAAPKRPRLIALKCHTGMARLGFNQGEAPRIIKALEELPDVEPIALLTHFATADMDDRPNVVREQLDIYLSLLEPLRAKWPHLAASVCNSAGALLGDEITRRVGPHIRRPGLTLYGCNPFKGTSLAEKGNGLRPAMEVTTRVMTLRTLEKGKTIGYGQTFTAPKDLRVAIIAAGYADGFSRGFSNKGVVCINGRRAPVIGRVSMQMTAVDVSDIPDVRVGGTVHLLGGNDAGRVGADELAGIWGTISYEVMCLFGINDKVYTGGSDR